MFARCPYLTKSNYQVGECYSLQTQMMYNSKAVAYFKRNGEIVNRRAERIPMVQVQFHYHVPRIARTDDTKGDPLQKAPRSYKNFTTVQSGSIHLRILLRSVHTHIHYVYFAIPLYLLCNDEELTVTRGGFARPNSLHHCTVQHSEVFELVPESAFELEFLSVLDPTVQYRWKIPEERHTTLYVARPLQKQYRGGHGSSRLMRKGIKMIQNVSEGTVQDYQHSAIQDSKKMKVLFFKIFLS